MDRNSYEEILKQSREANKQDRHRAELFAVMVTTEAWRAYVEVLNSRLQLFSEDLLKPGESVDGMVAQEFIKGAMNGLIVARDLPSAIVLGMKDSGMMKAEGEE